MITWFYGNTGAGKTTKARALVKESGAILLDGDELRGVWGLDLSTDGRLEQNNRVYKLAKLLESQGFDVVVAVICPFRAQRWSFQGVNFVYVEGGKSGEDYPFEK